MKLIVPSTGNLHGAVHLLQNYADVIYELYVAAPPNVLGSARARVYDTTSQVIAHHAQLCHQSGVRFSVLLNASCIFGQHVVPSFLEKLETLCNRMVEWEVDSVVVTDPYLIQWISAKFPSLEVVASSICGINNANLARWFVELGADRLTIPATVNRSFEVIDQIASAVDVAIECLVNEGCLLHCPFKIFHYNAMAHHTSDDFLKNYYHFTRSPFVYNCISKFLSHPAEILKSPWIRPQDLSRYESIGIHHFKIAGRNISTPFIERVVSAYARGYYEHNLLDLLNVQQFVLDSLYINTSALDEVLEHIYQCAKNCYVCTYCDAQARHLVTLRRKQYGADQPVP